MHRKPIRRAAVPMVAVLVAGLATATPSDGDTALGTDHVAAVSFSESGLDLMPTTPYRQAVLLVSGPGGDELIELGAGQRLLLGATGFDGKLRPDGRYTWRLELLPTTEMAKQLRAAASRGLDAESTAAPNRTVRNGAFAVVNGQVVDPRLREPTERAVFEAAGPPALVTALRTDYADADGAVLSANLTTDSPPPTAAAAGPISTVYADSDAMAPATALAPRSALTESQALDNGRPAGAKPQSN